uniref:septum site-determining protein MinC n=1 Tax=Agathobacter sp. TaxID=2021311 RepID=UPI004057730A
MSKHVVIKHNRYGIELVLDDKVPFEELLSLVAEKFQASSDFFKDAKLAISFKGKKLSEKETLAMVDAIMENSSIQIVSIMENGTEMEEAMKERVDAYNANLIASMEQQGHGQPVMGEEMYAQYPVDEQSIISDFYIGNLRSGQVLECVSSVTLVGDVNPGAKIVSEGNIVVLGALKGNAHAGVAGNDNCFIFALDMSPIQLQVGQYYAKSPDKEEVVKKRFGRKIRENTEGYSPKIATAREGNIYIEPMKKGCLDSL